jgi:hypothetical protein
VAPGFNPAIARIAALKRCATSGNRVAPGFSPALFEGLPQRRPHHVTIRAQSAKTSRR